MKTFFRFASAVFVLLSLSCLGADSITLQVPAGSALRQSGSFALAEGDVATLVYSSLTGGTSQVAVDFGSSSTVLSIQLISGVHFGPMTITGPATIRAQKASESPTIEIVTFSIQRANSPTNATPANAVVIPEDATGQYQVILEASTDLVTWTAANPGNYGGTTQKRFFRTRIVKLN